MSETEEWETTLARLPTSSESILTKNYKIEIRDSVNTGKVTVVVNGVALI